MFLFTILTIFRMVVIPVEFQDREFSCDSLSIATRIQLAQSYFDSAFSDGSRIEFEIADKVCLSQKSSYYGKNYTNRKDALLHEALREACTKSKSAFENLGNNELNNVILLFAGNSEDNTGEADLIYQQHSHLSNYGAGSLTISGKQIDSFCACSELAVDPDGNEITSGIGVFCHEVGHAFGFVDLYDTDGEASGGLTEGTGGASLMDESCKRGDGNSPPPFSAIEYEILGIGTCEELSIGQYSLESITTSGKYLKAKGDVEGEYYLFNCGEEGELFIYHIDKSDNAAGYSDYYGRVLTAAQRWELGQINCNPEHLCARLVAKLPSDAEPYFGSDTKPSFRFWSGHSSSLALINIKSNGSDKVSFEIVEPLIINKILPYQDAATVYWSVDERLPNNLGFEIICNDICAVIDASERSYTLEGLKANTDYELNLRVKLAEDIAFSDSGVFSTKSYIPNTYPYIYLSGVARNKDGSFIKGQRIPLRVYNAGEVLAVNWYLDDESISADSDGYYDLERSGVLKAVLSYPDGSKEIIIKEIAL